MGIFSGLLGNASKKDNDKVERQLENILILVDKQGVTGKKTSYKSIPYHSISRFTVESSGNFDLDAELKIWISSALEPAEVLQFKSDNNVFEIQQALATAVLE